MQERSTRVRIALRICDAIKGRIIAGSLGPGARLPSTRSLAAEWGVSRTTATDAYEQLTAEGYLETRQGTRATVAHGLENPASAPKRRAARHAPAKLSQYGRRTVELVAPFQSDTMRLSADFHYGDLSMADFPALAWKKAANNVLQKRHASLRYGDPAGLWTLRNSLRGYLWRARGLQCDPEQIVVVNGSQQGLDLCARLLLDPGDRVIMENPGYILARQVFLASGAKVIPWVVDREGMQTKDLPAAKLAYVTPSHQYPLGSVMSAPRRTSLLEWAQRTEAYILEDDYDGEYRFDINPIPPLQTMDNLSRVIYIGTVSKTLSPTLRLGYLILPWALTESFGKAKRLTDRHTPSLEQDTLTSLIDSGAYERHVRRVRRKNSERRAALLTALSEALGDRVAIAGADAGLHVIIWLRGISRGQEQAVITRAHAAGVGLYPVSPLYATNTLSTFLPETAGLVMGYASLDPPAIKKGILILKNVLDTLVTEQLMPRRSRK